MPQPTSIIDVWDDTYFPNVTIVLQGIIHNDISIHRLLDYCTKICPVVLSIYESDMPKLLPLISLYSNITVLTNKLDIFIDEYNRLPDKPLIEDTNYFRNGYLLYKSLVSTLPVIKTQYVLKSRIDHQYNGLRNVIRTGLSSDKIITSSLYVRGCQATSNRYKYHLSDCLFMLKTEEFNELLSLSLYTSWVKEIPEVKLWKNYLLKRCGLTELSSLDDYIKSMMDNVHVIPLTEIKPERIKLRDVIYNTNDIIETLQPQINYFKYGIGCNI